MEDSVCYQRRLSYALTWGSMTTDPISTLFRKFTLRLPYQSPIYLQSDSYNQRYSDSLSKREYEQDNSSHQRHHGQSWRSHRHLLCSLSWLWLRAHKRSVVRVSPPSQALRVEYQEQERKKANAAFRIALVEQFGSIYGTDENKLDALQRLCGKLGIDPIPTSITACKKVRGVTIYESEHD